MGVKASADRRVPARLLIAGGGVAALEALLAVRELARERVAIELLAPEREFVYRPMAVGEPFGLGPARREDLAEIAADRGATLHADALASVDPVWRQVRTRAGEELDYDMLLVAVGARPTVALPGAVTVSGPGRAGRMRTVLRELEERRVRRVVFAVPGGATWSLPLYELALMTARRAAALGLRGVELTLVTPEAEPLQVFGRRASAAVAALLAEHGVTFLGGLYPAAVERGSLAVGGRPAPPVRAERVVSLPRLAGPPIPGLPHDAAGFIPVDLSCRVVGEPDVYAAGDVTCFSVKQGGLAAQQADAAAEDIAARAGAPVVPRPFDPVLRGLLLTGGAPRYLRAEIVGGRGEASEAATSALWWPPSKIAGRYLAPYLAARASAGPPAAPAAEGTLPVEVRLESEGGVPGARRRAIISPGAGGGSAVLPVGGEGHGRLRSRP